MTCDWTATLLTGLPCRPLFSDNCILEPRAGFRSQSSRKRDQHVDSADSSVAFVETRSKTANLTCTQREQNLLDPLLSDCVCPCRFDCVRVLFGVCCVACARALYELWTTGNRTVCICHVPHPQFSQDD